MKNLNSFISKLKCVLLMSVGFNAAGEAFNYSAGPNWGPNKTVQLEVQSECSNDGCPYAGAPSEYCEVRASVEGKTTTKYNAGAEITQSAWKLSGGWAEEEVKGTAGTVIKTWETRCVAHNADIAKTYRNGTLIFYTTVGGQITTTKTEYLTQTISLFARAYGKPDAAQPSPCDPKCPE